MTNFVSGTLVKCFHPREAPTGKVGSVFLSYTLNGRRTVDIRYQDGMIYTVDAEKDGVVKYGS